jgi:hypothetical protein
MVPVQGLGRAEVHRNAVLYNPILLQNPVENGKRPAAIHHVVFGNDFEPIHYRFSLQDVAVMRYSQSNANPVVGEPIKPVCRHKSLILS